MIRCEGCDKKGKRTSHWVDFSFLWEGREAGIGRVYVYVRAFSFERSHLRGVHVLVRLSDFGIQMIPDGGKLGSIHADHTKLVDLETKV